MVRSATVSRRTAKQSSRGIAGQKGRTATGKRSTPGDRRAASRARTPSGRTGRTAKKAGIRTYRSALAFLDSLVNYEQRPPKTRGRGVFTLSRVKRLLADLGNPHKSFRTVHIAGTKGKGSTAAMLSHMLQGNGLRVGLFTSPHIMNVRERISINDGLISEAAMTRLVSRIAQCLESSKDDRITFFETLTAVAFLYFKEKKVDLAIVETGLGGRFDSTNVVRPEVCGITSISIDHTAQLGESLEEIAEEKAGIFKEGVPVVSAPQCEPVKKALRKAAAKTHAPLFFAGDEIVFSYRFESSHTAGPQARIGVATPTSHFDHVAVPLVGQHQAVNCGVALGLLDQLKNRGFAIDDEEAIAGLANVRLPGRMEMLCDNPRVIADAAHNAASIEALMRAIGQNVPYDSMVVIFGCCADKDVAGMLRLIRLGADKVIFTRVNHPRSADSQELGVAFAEGGGRMAQVASSLPEALEIAEKAVSRDDLICITGSFYLVSEAKAHFANHPHRAEPAALVAS